MLDTLVDFGVIDKEPENKSGESAMIKIKKEVNDEELEPGEIRDDDDESQAWPLRLFLSIYY